MQPELCISVLRKFFQVVVIFAAEDACFAFARTHLDHSQTIFNMRIGISASDCPTHTAMVARAEVGSRPG